MSFFTIEWYRNFATYENYASNTRCIGLIRQFHCEASILGTYSSKLKSYDLENTVQKFKSLLIQRAATRSCGMRQPECMSQNRSRHVSDQYMDQI